MNEACSPVFGGTPVKPRVVRPPNGVAALRGVQALFLPIRPEEKKQTNKQTNNENKGNLVPSRLQAASAVQVYGVCVCVCVFFFLLVLHILGFPYIISFIKSWACDIVRPIIIRVYMCVLHLKPFFLPIDIQNNQWPCRFFNES